VVVENDLYDGLSDSLGDRIVVHRTIGKQTLDENGARVVTGLERAVYFRLRIGRAP
jgi:hypothetical protein